MTDAAILQKKLQARPGARLLLINAPPQIAQALAGADLVLTGPGEASDGVVAFCEDPGQVAAFSAQALAVLPPDGLLWFAYRKGPAAKASGLSRDVGWSAVFERGYRGVRSIAFDDIWTGLRFRETARVKSA